MKLSLKLTLDGLMRALRLHAHRSLETIETSRLVPPAERVVRRRPTAQAQSDARIREHGRSRD